MNTRLSKTRCGYVQPLPRHPASTQHAAMERCGVGTIFDEDRDVNARVDMIDQLRRGDTLHVTHLHVLAKRMRRTDHNMRLDLWQALREVERRGATITETETGRSTADKSQRDDMIRDAIEVLTRAHKARPAKTARANGMLGGRPRKQFKPEQVEAARAAWFDARLYGVTLKRALLSTGHSLSRCYDEFGPRSGRK